MATVKRPDPKPNEGALKWCTRCSRRHRKVYQLDTDPCGLVAGRRKAKSGKMMDVLFLRPKAQRKTKARKS